MQEGVHTFYDSELKVDFTLDELDPEYAIMLAYNYYRDRDDYDWCEADYIDCEAWMWMALDYKDGMFDPRKQDILAVEQYFDIELPHKWAKYDFQLPNGEHLQGQLSLKGTVDLVLRGLDNSIEIVDWKTGSRMSDWATGKPKTYETLYDDAQLRLYHYAISKLYPQVDHILVTIFYIRCGGPHTLYFERDELGHTEELIKQRFTDIKACDRPKLIYPNFKCNWCHFSKNTLDGEPTREYAESICKVVHDDVIQLGMDKVVGKYAKDQSFSKYGSGGGRSG
jgi:hypothetical protein